MTVTFKLTGSAVELIYDRGWAYMPSAVEGPDAHATYRDVMSAPHVRVGFGSRHTVTTNPTGARKLMGYLESLVGLKGIGDLDPGDSFNREADVAFIAAKSIKTALTSENMLDNFNAAR